MFDTRIDVTATVNDVVSIAGVRLKIDTGPDAQKWGRGIDLPHILAV